MRGMLFSQMEPPVELEAEFHDWYETEHVPARLAIPGFELATRYRAVEGGPKYLATYELGEIDALDSTEYRSLKDHPSRRTRLMLGAVDGFTRFTCAQISDTGPSRNLHCYLSVVAFVVPLAEESALDAWYEEEHVPLLLEAEDWLRVRRYRVLNGEGGRWTHLALHELASLTVLDSPQRARARRGPRRDALTTRPWFSGSGRWLYEVLSRASASDLPATQGRE